MIMMAVNFQPGFFLPCRWRVWVVAVVRAGGGCSIPIVPATVPRAAIRAAIRAARRSRVGLTRARAGISGDGVRDAVSRKELRPRRARLEGLGGSVTGMWVLGQTDGRSIGESGGMKARACSAPGGGDPTHGIGSPGVDSGDTSGVREAGDELLKGSGVDVAVDTGDEATLAARACDKL